MENEKLYEMTGSVEQVIFRNEQNGYAVIELNNSEELVTVVGTMPYIGVGEELHVVGNWITSPTYGTQFKAQALERSRPSDAAAMLKYLASGAVKGVGPAIAQKIVNAFGNNTLDILENSPKRLCEIKGITPQKAEKIGQEFQRMGGIRELILKLGGYEIGRASVWKECRSRWSPYH